MSNRKPLALLDAYLVNLLYAAQLLSILVLSTHVVAALSAEKLLQLSAEADVSSQLCQCCCSVNIHRIYSIVYMCFALSTCVVSLKKEADFK